MVTPAIFYITNADGGIKLMEKILSSLVKTTSSSDPLSMKKRPKGASFLPTILPFTNRDANILG